VSSYLWCHGCGRRFDSASTPAFGCPAGVEGDDVDHLLEPVIEGRRWPSSSEANPLLRYRGLTLAATLIDDARLVGIIDELDAAVARVDGHGFRITPWRMADRVGEPGGAAEPGGGFWFKDETDNVGGSHKGRHLAGVMVYLRVLEALGRLERRPLAIASCGNAALAAAVVARAADWPVQVFVPTDAEAAVLDKLAKLGADVHACPRDPAVPGDPAVHAFRRALAAGALPFSVQGDVCGISVEGGRTIGWELADQGPLPDVLYVQVGGGALLSAVWQGLRDARDLGRIDRLPRICSVQTEGAWPLRRAWRRLQGDGGAGGAGGAGGTAGAAGAAARLAEAARHRSHYMWPWEEPPHSIAHGILDDETYDWWACCQAMAETGGDAIVVDEDTLRRANALARGATGLSVSFTGSAGLAGMLAAPPVAGETAGVLLTGVDRGG